ncbi:class I SAM-dependent methyltransferase [uncultured Paludibaculum sp.]|uniref:class I SAM-dependent methyltransferase n=1 Tax=uncultured Paludibaculum sp. TaxID=1765020 RepID=UPI002AAB2BAB|nr:class I SAM-dependent methyltransferase [uncultured Paludibaculum sp.]
MQQTVAEWAAPRSSQPMRSLLLGVTPDIALMPWPPTMSLIAMDSACGMVRSVWPGDLPGRRHALCANWSSLPLPAASCDIVLGDGSMNCLRFPGPVRALAESVHSVLREDGLFLLRCYARPTPCERPEDVFTDLLRNAISTFHHFKFRLLMAVQQTPEQGVCVNDVYTAWARRHIDVPALCAQTGWAPETVRTIDLYQGSATVHTFPSLPDFRSVLDDLFEEVSVSIHSYELSECCPTLVMRPRRAGCLSKGTR